MPRDWRSRAAVTKVKRRLPKRSQVKRSRKPAKRRTRYTKGAGFSGPLLSTALRLASNPHVTHGVLSAANRLAPVAQKFIGLHPQGAMFKQALQAASPYLQRYREDPHGAVRSVMSSPVAQQIMSHVSTHLPLLQQTANCLMSPQDQRGMNPQEQRGPKPYLQTANRQPNVNPYGPQNFNLRQGDGRQQQGFSPPNSQAYGDWQRGGKRRRKATRKQQKRSSRMRKSRR